MENRENSFKKNDTIETEIIDISHDGEGIGKVDGYPFFIKDTVIGDRILARVTKVKKNYGYARVEKILKPSDWRIEPPCKLYRQCGGCQIQAMDYQEQLAFKQRKVRDQLIHIGGFSEKLVEETGEPVVGMEYPFRYRNKAQYPVGQNRDGEPVTGFYAGRTHSIIESTECYLGAEENQVILQAVLTYMKENHVPAYDEESHKGLIRHILIRKGFTSGELMVCLVINSRKQLPFQDRLIRLLQEIPGMTSISLSHNLEKTNVIMGGEVTTIWGNDRIQDTIHVRDVLHDFALTDQGITFSISPLSFYQVNPVQTEKLYSLALSYAALTGKETVWDLYCGIGTISLFLSGRAKQVYGVEIIPQAIEDARKNAERNHITNAEFFVGKAEEVLPEKYGQEGIFADVIVVDPPRKGCDGACLDTMLKMKPERIVYVSCDSATLSRDLKILCEGGYELKKWRAVDQFPMTVHVETVVFLSKQKPDDTIEIDLDLDELDATTAETKATYEEIKAYVWDKHHLKVSSLYISQVKRKCGLEVGQNYNLSKSENPKVPKCPPEKEAVIMGALKHFQMI